jgi:hypothetical protein
LIWNSIPNFCLFLYNYDQLFIKPLNIGKAMQPLGRGELNGTQLMARRMLLLAELDSWSSESTGNTRVAIQRMIACYDGGAGSHKLDLSDLGLSSLPSVIMNELTFLTELNLSSNYLRTLPRNFWNLCNLQMLDCRNNQLEIIPVEGIQLVEHLAVLDLSNNKLFALPHQIRNMRNLRILNCANNNFEALPACLEGLGNATRLDFSRNCINSFMVPVAFRQPNLIIDDQRRAVPREQNLESPAPRPVPRPTVVPSIVLTGGRASNFFGGSERELSDREIAELLNSGFFGQSEPENAQPRPPSPVITRRPVNPALLQPQNPAPAPRPVIVRPVLRDAPANSFEAMKRAVPDGKQDLWQLEVPTVRGDRALWNNLIAWLDKLIRAADYNNETTRPLTAERVLSVVQMAEQDQVYRQVFSNTLAEASDRCTDKATYHLTRLEIQRAITSAQAQSAHQMLEVLKGAFAAGLLEDCARELMATTHRGRDEVEVFLALQLKLKEEFNLPIGIRNMDYLYYAHLTEAHITKVKEKVKQQLQDKTRFAAFLILQEAWIQKLTDQFEEELGAFTAPVKDQMWELEEAKYEQRVNDQQYLDGVKRIQAEVKAAEQKYFDAKTKELLGLAPPVRVPAPAPVVAPVEAPAPVAPIVNPVAPAPRVRVELDAAPQIGPDLAASVAPRPAETVIVVRCKDLPLGRELFIRGKGAGLSWNRGVKLTRIDWERFEFRTSTPFSGELEYKLLISDDTKKWEAGANHRGVKQGKTVECTHTFGKDVLPTRTMTILTVDFEVPPGKILCMAGTGPLGSWDFMYPMESIRNDNKRWYIVFDEQKFPDFHYKLCLDGNVEQGGMRTGKWGSRTAMKTPRF